MSILDTENLPHTITIKDRQMTRDQWGARKVGLVNSATGEKCWVQNASAAEIEEFKKNDQQRIQRILFNSDPGLTKGQEVLVTAGPSHVGEEMRFLAATDRSAGLGWMFTGIFEVER